MIKAKSELFTAVLEPVGLAVVAVDIMKLLTRRSGFR